MNVIHLSKHTNINKIVKNNKFYEYKKNKRGCKISNNSQENAVCIFILFQAINILAKKKTE